MTRFDELMERADATALADAHEELRAHAAGRSGPPEVAVPAEIEAPDFALSLNWTALQKEARRSTPREALHSALDGLDPRFRKRLILGFAATMGVALVGTHKWATAALTAGDVLWNIAVALVLTGVGVVTMLAIGLALAVIAQEQLRESNAGLVAAPQLSGVGVAGGLSRATLSAAILREAVIASGLLLLAIAAIYLASAMLASAFRRQATLLAATAIRDREAFSLCSEAGTVDSVAFNEAMERLRAESGSLLADAMRRHVRSVEKPSSWADLPTAVQKEVASRGSSHYSFDPDSQLLTVRVPVSGSRAICARVDVGRVAAEFERTAILAQHLSASPVTIKR